MNSFWKIVFGTVVGLLIFHLVLTFILIIGIAIGSAVISAFGDTQGTIAENSVLEISIDGPITDREFDNPLEAFSVGPIGTKGMYEITQAIYKAAADDDISAIALKGGFPQAGYAVLSEIREALQVFQDSGKVIYAHADFYTEPGYFVASVADKIYVQREAFSISYGVEFNGFAYNAVFFKGLFDKIGVEPQIFRAGDYKSAGEMFTQTQLSEKNREQMTVLINDLYDVYLDGISSARNIPKSELRRIADSMKVENIEDAMAYGLIDGTLFHDQLLDTLGAYLDVEKPKMVSYKKYNDAVSSPLKGKNKVAVVFANGEIVDGQGDMDGIFVESTSKQLRELRKNDDISAVVFRINSPGGGVLASDKIRRELELLAIEKPLVASMSDLAASAGYYLASACDTIVASEQTITGSIGVVLFTFSAKELMNDKLGITTDEISTGPYANMYNFSEPMNEREKAKVQRSLEASYTDFVTRVAESLRLSPEAVDSVAGGRVWTGRMAKDVGLVHMEGGLYDAITLAASMGGVEDDYRIRTYPEELDFLQMLIKNLEEEQEKAYMQEKLGIYYQQWLQLNRLERYREPMAIWPFYSTVQ